MNGSGARDGFGSPPWGPAEPVPELEETQAIPGLGAASGPAASGPGDGIGYGATSRRAGTSGPGDAGPARPQGGPEFPRGSFGVGPAFGDAGFGGPGAGGPRTGGPRAGGRGTGGPSADQGTEQVPPEDAEEDGGGGGDRNGKHRKHRRSFWRELPVLVIVALVLALLIKSFAIQAFYIPSASMENTLEIGDRVLINKVVYHLRSIHRGDIIVFDGTGSWDFDSPPASSNLFSKAIDELEGIVGISHDSSIYIKRVIGLPGDHVACCNAEGQVTVNGVPLSESSYLYPGNAPSTQKFSIIVPAGRLWVMGDHRAVSYDSRGHMGDPGGGTIPESAVLGRAFVIIWPPSRWGFLNIPATFEQPQLNASNAAGGSAAAGGSSAALEAALDNGSPVRPATSPLPLALGFIVAVPITWLQRKARLRRKSRRPKS
jgi:signal peptidase I